MIGVEKRRSKIAMDTWHFQKEKEEINQLLLMWQRKDNGRSYKTLEEIRE